jgi:glycosyltransferase involved in cell wall biosynthesis
LYRYKRFDVAVDAIAMLDDLKRVRLRLAGTGPEEPQLRELATRRGVADRVEFLGRVDDMPAFVRSLDVLLCTSDSTETSCYAQLEAMSAAVPSVCSRYADLQVRVRDGVDGFLVTPGDVTSCAARLSQLIADADLRRRMGQQARQRVIDSYSRRAYLAATLRVYESMLRRSPDSPLSARRERFAAAKAEALRSPAGAGRASADSSRP